MRLSEFMVTHREKILSEWVAFARSCLTTPETMDLAELRDHASEMLDTIAADLNTLQTKLEQADKSEGKSDADRDSRSPDTAAQSHGAARAASGFTVQQMVSEYRALRASVIRLWIDAAGELTRKDLDDLVRFNEAIDQALAESTSRFTQDLEHSKEMFLAMLGHDLPLPLHLPSRVEIHDALRMQRGDLFHRLPADSGDVHFGANDRDATAPADFG